MADLNIISERNILYFDTVCGFPAVSTPIVISSDSLLRLPLPEQFDFLTKFGDILWERCDRGHDGFWASRSFMNISARWRAQRLIFTRRAFV